jgi:two-component system, chemotaxis family, chemotaxis protein CheY
MKKKILVVEDFASIRNFVCETLQRKGYDAIGAATAREAYDLLMREMRSIDLVLTDFNMPDETGYQLLLRIRRNAQTAHVPVIFLTTESNPEAILKAKEAGLNAWIKKPYKAENFFAQIHHALYPSTIL